MGATGSYECRWCGDWLEDDAQHKCRRTNMRVVIEYLRAENAELRRHATQRAARMQIMREWMTRQYPLPSSASSWDFFRHSRPEAVEWFDADGVPVECRERGKEA